MASVKDAPAPIAVPTVSNWQLAEQPSLAVVLVSSHCSPASTVPLPHRLEVSATRRR